MLIPSAAIATQPTIRMPTKQPNAISTQRTGAGSFLADFLGVTEFPKTMFFYDGRKRIASIVDRGDFTRKPRIRSRGSEVNAYRRAFGGTP